MAQTSEVTGPNKVEVARRDLNSSDLRDAAPALVILRRRLNSPEFVPFKFRKQ